MTLHLEGSQKAQGAQASSGWAVAALQARDALQRAPRRFLNHSLVQQWAVLHRIKGVLPSDAAYRAAVMSINSTIAAIDATMPATIEETHV